jgi:hypothetical protein
MTSKLLSLANPHLAQVLTDPDLPYQYCSGVLEARLLTDTPSYLSFGLAYFERIDPYIHKKREKKPDRSV